MEVYRLLLSALRLA